MPRRPRPPPPAADSAAERLLAEEVLHLHALWRQGPHHGSSPREGPSRRRLNQRKRRKQLTAEADDGEDAEWPLAPSPPAPSTSWPDGSASEPTPPAPATPSAAAVLAQRAALAAATDLFSKNASDGDGSESSDFEPSESDDGRGEGALGFFLGVFERDAALRGYYERSWEDGEFMCMACVGRRMRKGKARRFKGCVGLVQHARATTRCGRRRAHRALAVAVCRVLGWDMERLPSIVLSAHGPLGQTLAVDGTTTAAAKEDAETKSKDSSNDKEVHEQEVAKESAEKEDTKEVDPLSCEDSSKNEELHKETAQEALLESGLENSADCGKIKTSDSHNDENITERKEEPAKQVDDAGRSDTGGLENNSPEEEHANENKQEDAKNVDDTERADIAGQGNNSSQKSKGGDCDVTNGADGCESTSLGLDGSR